MSKNSAKQNVEQLIDWLEWRKSVNAKKEGKPKFSKADHYKKVNKHHGYKQSN